MGIISSNQFHFWLPYCLFELTSDEEPPVYDTINLYLETSGIQIADLLIKLDWYNEPKVGIRSGNLTVVGGIENQSTENRNIGKMYIRFSDTYPQKLSVSGSLAKFHYGDNLQKLTRSETRKAIEKLSERLSVNLKPAKVQRLDLGANLFMNRPCSEYQSLLNEVPRMLRSTVSSKSNSVYFTNSQRTIILYDKIADCRRLKEEIPELFNGRNVLRYELRFMKNIPVQFKGQTITAETLYSEPFYIEILNRWRESYFSISRNEGFKMKEDIDIHKPQDLLKHFAAIGIQQLGTGKVLDMLDNSRQSGKLTKMQVHRLKAKVKEITSTPELVEPNDCIKELDKKVNREVLCYR